MYISKWTPEKGRCHLFRPDLLGIPTSSAIFGVSVYGEQKTQPHCHIDSDEWFLVVDGKGNMEIGDQSHIMTAGGIVYTPENVWHAFQGIGGSFRFIYGIYGWRTHTRGELEKERLPKGRKSIILTLKEAKAKVSGGKLSLMLLEPRNVLRNNCLGVNYCIYPPGTKVEAHSHDTLEQVSYVISGTATIRVEKEVEAISKDEAAYIPMNTSHSLENKGNEPVATVNAYYVSRNLWKGNIETFLTKIDPHVESSMLRYPNEI